MRRCMKGSQVVPTVCEAVEHLEYLDAATTHRTWHTSAIAPHLPVRSLVQEKSQRGRVRLDRHVVGLPR